MKNSLILVCGPAATGKSTLVKSLLERYKEACNYRPSQVYLDIADENGIPRNEAFEAIDDKDAASYLCTICNSFGLVIGDQHLAIQYKRDSQLASKGYSQDDNLDEDYVPALSDEYMEELKKSRTNVLLILLTGDAETLYSRAISRHQEIGQPIRNKSLEDTEKEIEAERRIFQEYTSRYQVSGCTIDTTKKDKEEVLRDAIHAIDEFGRKSHSATQWSGELSSKGQLYLHKSNRDKRH